MSRYWHVFEVRYWYCCFWINIYLHTPCLLCQTQKYVRTSRNSLSPTIIFQKRFPLNLFNIQDKWGITQLPVLICPFFPCIRTTIKAYPRCHDFHIYLCFFVKCKAWKEGFESKLFRPNTKFWLCKTVDTVKT